MDSIREQMLRGTADAEDDVLMAMASGLGTLAGQIRELAASIQLCEPSDEGVVILTAAAECIEQRVAMVRKHPEVIREVAVRRLRGAMRLIDDPSPAPCDATPKAREPSEAFWRMLGALAREAARAVPSNRDHRTLLRVISIAERQMIAAAPRRAEEARPRRLMSLVPGTSAEESERGAPAGASPDGGRHDDGTHA